MMILIFATISIAFLLLVAYWLRRSHALDSDAGFAEKSATRSFGHGNWLALSERIFDPSDVRWLEDELAFPKLAETLKISRKRLAIRWLQALQASFDELVRTPAESGESPQGMAAESWKLLWLTLRFKGLIGYALLMVRVFGPYHRLIPSFSWVPSMPGGERSLRRVALAANRQSR